MIASKVPNQTIVEVSQRDITPRILTDLSAVTLAKKSHRKNDRIRKPSTFRGENSTKNSVKIKEAKVDDYLGAYGLVD